MSIINIDRPENKEQINVFLNKMKDFDNYTLISAYNLEKRIVGVLAQYLYLHALHVLFIERFNKSPLIINTQGDINLSGPIYYLDALDSFDWFNKN